MQVQFSLTGATLSGVKAVPVDVEVLVSSGLPSFLIVGMADAAIQEARERIRAAVRACGFEMPNGKVVVNLAPGSLKKTGSGFDLPIALALLAATKQVNPEPLKKCLLVGELSLEGFVRPVKGMLAYEICAQNLGLDIMCAQPLDGLMSLHNLDAFIVKNLHDFRSQAFSKPVFRTTGKAPSVLDYLEIAGHETAKRAFQVAAAGGHGVLLMGPPGSGKTMLAARLASILPPLSEKEKEQSALVHSVAGEDVSKVLEGIRPFRNPHHSATTAGLVGGGAPLKPGEISLAHNGVLFLDEFAEFKPSALQSIRQPLETGHVTITRADGKYTLPARFMLVAASNPCPCGYYGDPEIDCACSYSQIKTYQNRIGGPLMDRIDIHIDVWRVKPGDVLRAGQGKSSEEMKEAVLVAREYAAFRKSKEKELDPHSTIALLRVCALSSGDEEFLENMAQLHHMSGRGIMRTLSLARTIADMDTAPTVHKVHICEALGLRVQEGIGMSS